MALVLIIAQRCTKCRQLKMANEFSRPHKHLSKICNGCKPPEGFRRCNICTAFRPKDDFYTRPGGRWLMSMCKSCSKKKSVEWAKKNARMLLDRRKEWFSRQPPSKQLEIRQKTKAINDQRRKNDPSFNKMMREYRKSRSEKDPLFKATIALRSLTHGAFKRRNRPKGKKTLAILGCDWNTAKRHIEDQFQDGMTWDNYGKWHIDHIIPLSNAVDENDLIELCNYKNLRPLWATENLRKHNKIGYFDKKGKGRLF